jgi:hypothetical protein
MSQFKKLVGEVRHVGRVLMSGGPEDCCQLDALVVRDSDNGEVIRMVDVIVPNAIHEVLKPGEIGQLEILMLNYPKPFGSAARYFVLRLESANEWIDGTSNVKAWVRGSKGAALHFLWFGLILMPAFGFGLLLWICAARLLALNVPPAVAVSSQRG